MRSCLIGLCLFISGVCAADPWTPGQPIPPGSSTGVEFNVNQVYYASQEIVVAAWGDATSSFLPFFSLFDGTLWTTAAPIPSGASAGVLYDIYLTYDAARQTVVAAWADSITFIPYYTVFNGSSWTTPLPIPLGSSTGVHQDVILAYDEARQTVVAAWGEASGMTFPAYYAVFDGTTWTTPGTLIPLGTSNGVFKDVTLAYNPALQIIFAAWGDSLDPFIAYSIFDGTNWNTPTPFAFLTSTGIQENVNLVYDAARQNIVAAWADGLTHSNFYALFNGLTRTKWGKIPQGASGGAFLNVNLAYNPDSNTVFAAWGDNSSPFHPFYSIFDGTNWTIGQEIPIGESTGANYDITLAYHLASRKMVAAWANYPDIFLPFFSTFLTPVAPPSDLVAAACAKSSITGKNVTNVITWTPSPDPSVVSYFLSRDGILIGIIPARGPFVFFDSHVCKNQTYVYTLTAVNGSGDESLPITVTISG